MRPGADRCARRAPRSTPATAGPSPQLARSEVTVALSGDGGDELFAGYPRYPRCLRRWQVLAPIPLRLRRSAAALLGRLADRSWEEGGPRRLGGLERPAEWIGAPSLPELFRLMNARCNAPADYVVGAEALPGPYRAVGRAERQRQPIDWMMAMDLAGHLPEDILVKVYRASMAVGLEVARAAARPSRARVRVDAAARDADPRGRDEGGAARAPRAPRPAHRAWNLVLAFPGTNRPPLPRVAPHALAACNTRVAYSKLIRAVFSL